MGNNSSQEQLHIQVQSRFSQISPILFNMSRKFVLTEDRDMVLCPNKQHFYWS